MRHPDNLIQIEARWPEDVIHWAECFNDATRNGNLTTFMALGASDEFIDKYKEDFKCYQKHWAAKDAVKKGKPERKSASAYTLEDYMPKQTDWAAVNRLIDKRCRLEEGSRMWFRLICYKDWYADYDKGRRGT